MNYVMTYIKAGLGNKVYMTLNMVYFFLELRKLNPSYTKIYFGIAISHHEKGKGEIDDFRNIFPNVLTYDWLEYIEDDEFDRLKKDCIFVKQNNMDLKKVSKINTPLWIRANYNMSGIPTKKYFPLFREMFSVNPKLLDFEYPYDYEKDIFVHIRYGDKVKIVREGGMNILLMTPQFYQDALKLIKSKTNGKVYIFTDSPEIVREKIFPKKIFPDENIIITSEPSYVVFHLTKMFKHVIITDSSLTQTAALFNENPKELISFSYAHYEPFNKFNPNFYWPEPFPFLFYYKNYQLGINAFNRKIYKQFTNLEYILDKTKVKLIEL